jgi:NAD(P)-dependent dehydrogenase (short-subunit alcohol dehydrogenase family)
VAAEHHGPGASGLSPPALAGKVALVTGGGRGIGRAIAVALAREGATVAAAARTRSEIVDAAAECGGGAIAVPLDVTSEADCAAAVETCRRELGGLDVLVNGAGIATSCKFVDLSIQSWREIMTTDLDGPFFMTRAAVPLMLARGWGRVISIGSIASRTGAPYVAAYTAAKHGLLGLMRSLAAEYAAAGLTFNCVCPGFTDTAMTDETVRNIAAKTGRSSAEARAALFSPQARLITPAEVAAVCVLLASEPGRSINGQAITIDGGALLA